MPTDPQEIVAKLRDYDDCHDGVIDDAAIHIAHLHRVLERIRERMCGSRTRKQWDALASEIRDDISHVLKEPIQGG